jgi:hypothetical protein
MAIPLDDDCSDIPYWFGVCRAIRRIEVTGVQ